MCGIREEKISAKAPGRMELMCIEMGKTFGGECFRGKINGSRLDMLSFKCLLDVYLKLLSRCLGV